MYTLYMSARPDLGAVRALTALTTKNDSPPIPQPQTAQMALETFEMDRYGLHLSYKKIWMDSDASSTFYDSKRTLCRACLGFPWSFL